MLKTAGFTTVYSLAGGISAWNGMTAAGSPEAGMFLFPADADTPELTAVAWSLEEGSRKFYLQLAGMNETGEAAKLFATLASAEERHKQALQDLYRSFSGTELLQPEAGAERMEGGMKIEDAVSWVRGRSVPAVLDLAMSLETDSYDLYIKMFRLAREETAKRVFGTLVAEEKEHLKRMARMMDNSAD